MTDVDVRHAPTPGHGRDRGPGATRAEDTPVLERLCPYVLTPQGWRSPRPTSGHRCTAVTPPSRLTSEKQGRLCLTPTHVTCATYVAAGEARVARGIPDGSGRRPLARTAPVVLERMHARLPADLDAGARRWGQAGLIILMLVALVAVVVARSTGRPASPADGVVTGTQPGAISASVAPVTLAPIGTASTAPESASAPPSGSPSGSPSSPVGARSYTVKKGDTLSGIAARFGTTVAALQKANQIPSSNTIRVGQVLTIP